MEGEHPEGAAQRQPEAHESGGETAPRPDRAVRTQQSAQGIEHRVQAAALERF
jgi:hypothetical protein